MLDAAAGRRFPKFAPKRLAGQRLGFQRLRPVGVHIQRIQEGADFGRDELAGRQQGMHAQGLADVVGQQALSEPASTAARVKLAVTRNTP